MKKDPHLSRWRIARFVPAAFLAGLLLLAGCRNEASDPTAVIDLDSLPVSVPEPVLTVDAIDTMLFALLYPYTIPLDDGSVIIADLRRSQVYQLNRDGTGRVVADNGRGPGEVRFVNKLSLGPDGYLYLYDRGNTRVTLFNRDLAYEREFVVIRSEDRLGDRLEIRLLYPTAEPDLILAYGAYPRDIRDRNPDPDRVIGLYRPEEGRYSDWIRIPGGRLAFTFIDGELQLIRQVPYMPMTHFSMHPEGRSFFLYWPPSEEIVELSLSMDTLRVIPIALPEERFISSEQDSLLDRIDFIHSTERRDLHSMLPEVKTPVDRFLVDDLGRFWFKLTRRSPAQEWLVLDKEGTPQQIVQHPKEGWVTHVSSQNIGVREEDMMTFTLYELVD